MPGGGRILVIKHGALGDWVLATGPFAAIRRHHPAAHVTLLTAPAFAGWGKACGWFDDVWRDERPGWTRPLAWAKLRRRLAAGRFCRIYDLQTSDRSNFYHRLLPRRGRPQWSGIAAGCSHPHRNPRRDSMHVLALRAEQLAVAGIAWVPPPCLDWLDGDVAALAPPGPFALLIAGGAAHRPDKRWPAQGYAALARALLGRGITPVLIGTAAEAAALAAVARLAPGAVDLCSRTGLGQVAALARRARVAVGNDTGPVHIAATVGCPTVALFGAASDPARSAPVGARVRVLRHVPLARLPSAAVMAEVERLRRGA